MQPTRRGLIIILTLFSFGLYLKSLPPTIYVGDSGEFIISALSLDIAHPPGYPLLSLLLKPLTILPYGNVAMRGNTATALVAALCLAGVFWFSQAYQTTGGAAFSTIFLGITYLFWNCASAPEAYILHLGILIIAVFSWLSAWNDFRYLFVFSLVLGVGLGNHYLILYLYPLGAFLLYRHWRRLSHKHIIILLITILLGASLLFYFPLRAVKQPLLNWSNPDSLSRWLAHVKRDVYYRLEFGQTVTTGEKIQFGWHFFQLWTAQFFFLFFPLAIWGGLKLFKRKPLLFWLTLYLFFIHSIFTIAVFHFPYNSQNLIRVEPYYLPAFWISFFWLGCAWPENGGFKNILCRQALFVTMLFLLLGSAGYFYSQPFFAAYQNIAHRQVFYPYYYGRNMLDSTTPNSALFLSEDTEKNVALFLTGILGYRPDVSVFAWNNSRDVHLKNRGNMYLSVERTFAKEPDFPKQFLIPQGPLFLLTQTQPPTALLFKQNNLINLSDIDNNDYRLNWIVSDTYLMFGFNSEFRGEPLSARLYWLKAAAWGGADYLTLNNVGTVFYDEGDYQAAATCFERSLKLYPGYSLARHNLDLARSKSGG